MSESWGTRTFSLSLAVGQDRSDVPALLRHMADTLERLGPVYVRDLILGDEVTADGIEYHLTVYFDHDGTHEDAGKLPRRLAAVADLKPADGHDG